MLFVYSELWVKFATTRVCISTQVIDYDRKIINDDRVKIRVKYSLDPLPISPVGDDDFGYQTIKNSIRQVFPVAAVAPCK